MALAITTTTLTVTTTVNPGSGIQLTGTTFALAAASGATGAVSWRVVAGALPPGMYLDNTGVLRGMAEARGTALVTIRATDSSTPPLFVDAAVEVVVS
jgi:hypothetical protein